MRMALPELLSPTGVGPLLSEACQRPDSDQGFQPWLTTIACHASED